MICFSFCIFISNRKLTVLCGYFHFFFCRFLLGMGTGLNRTQSWKMNFSARINFIWIIMNHDSFIFTHDAIYECVHFCIKQSLATYAVNSCSDASQSYELTSLCFLEFFKIWNLLLVSQISLIIIMMSVRKYDSCPCLEH
jgi:hypothetical protein